MYIRRMSVFNVSKCKQSTQYVGLVVLDYFDAREEFFISFKDLKDNVTVNWIPSLLKICDCSKNSSLMF